MSRSPYVIGPIDGFTPQIANLVGMMTYARTTTIDAARGLTLAQLDHVHDGKSNSIGALLAHIAAVETYYQVDTFESRGLSDVEREVWDAALNLGPRSRTQITGRDLNVYLDSLAAVRMRTLSELAQRDDSWLYQESEFAHGKPANNLFKWFHVMEDEINHRGQIRWLKKRV